VANYEWREQVRFAALLDRWLDDTCAFATSTDPVASSALSGWLRRRRGVKAGVSDTLVVYLGKLIGLEMKSFIGRCSVAQRAVREALLRAGAAELQKTFGVVAHSETLLAPAQRASQAGR
jgi:hypothetical protein